MKQPALNYAVPSDSPQRPLHPSLLFAQGKTMHFVQDQLGHHDPKFTASVYAHLIPDDRCSEVDFLDGLGRAQRRLQ